MAEEGSSGGSSPSWGLVLVRIAVGWIMLKAGWMKVSGGVGEELVTGTREAIANGPGFMKAWGENVVLAHPWFFAHLIAWGELLGGLAFFLGAFTRPAGIALAFMFANFWFAGPESTKPLVLLLAVCALGCAISRAGRSMGADVFLDEKLPRWMTWYRIPAREIPPDRMRPSTRSSVYEGNRKERLTRSHHETSLGTDDDPGRRLLDDPVHLEGQGGRGQRVLPARLLRRRSRLLHGPREARAEPGRDDRLLRRRGGLLRDPGRGRALSAGRR